MDELALFAGAGGGILGGKLLGWRTRCAVEINPFCRRVLLARQRDGLLDRFPIWDDIRTFDPDPWRGRIDVISGGFPCQDISSAGKGAGLAGKNSGLVFEMLWVINAIRPRFVFAENSPNLRTRGLGSILQALDSMGYNANWGVLGAWHSGAPHRRNRLWVKARLPDPDGAELRDQPRGRGGSRGQEKDESAINGETEQVANSDETYDSGDRFSVRNESTFARVGRVSCCASSEHVANTSKCARDKGKSPSIFREVPGGLKGKGNQSPWEIEPPMGRVANGVANRVDRLKALGNGQVPSVAALAWTVL